MNDSRLRLLQVVHGYPPAVGGVERSTRDLCEALVAEHGFEVTVATTNTYAVTGFHDAFLPTIRIVENEIQNGVQIRRFGVSTRWDATLRQAQRFAWKLRLPGNDRLRTWYSGPRSSGMRDAVRRFEADVVCAASLPLNHMRYPFLRPEPRPPVVLVVAAHTNDAWGFERPYLLRLMRQAFATIAHTDHEREWLISRGAPPDRVHTIGHGIDPENLKPRPGAFRAAHAIDRNGLLIAFVGQHAGHKGIDTLVEVFPALLERMPDAWLAIAGSRTPFTNEVGRLVARLPAPARARVRVVADLSEQERADALGDCDIFASPSAAESFGITTLEAWALRKPVLVGDAPSQRSVVDEGVNGLIVRYRDSGALVAALERLGDARLRRSLGEAGHAKLLERYRSVEIERAYAELFRSAAEAGRRSLRSK